MSIMYHRGNMLNKIIFFMFLIFLTYSYGIIVLIYGFQGLIAIPELFEMDPKLTKSELFKGLYACSSTLLMLWAMYRGAFRKFINPKIVYLVVINTFISTIPYIYGVFVINDLQVGVFLIIICLSRTILATKVILAAKRILPMTDCATD